MQDISSLNVVDLLLDAVCMVRADSEIVFASAAFERIFGYAPAEVIGRRMLEMVHPDDRAATQDQARRVTEGDLQLQFENRYLRKDGKIAHIRWTARWLPEQQVRLAVAHDITERKRTESVHAAVHAISEAAHGAQTIPELCTRIHEIIGGLLPAPDFSVALRDPETGRLAVPYPALPAPWDPALDAARLALHHEILNSGRPLLRHDDTADSAARPQERPETGPHALRPQCWMGVPLLTSQGATGALLLRSTDNASRYDERDLELLQFVSTQVAAAVERTQMLGHLEHLARYDHLTHLPNRQLFMDRLKMALARARSERHRLSLLFIDLDRFKSVNDSLGHAMGDLLLQRVAQRLLECVRGSDTVARLGGDEFVVLLDNGEAREHATLVAQKILASFGHPFDLEGTSVAMRPSIGVAFFPDHGADEHRLLGRADHAMYLSKKQGGNQVRVAAAPPPAAAD